MKTVFGKPRENDDEQYVCNVGAPPHKQANMNSAES